jgi:hypothetical protein
MEILAAWAIGWLIGLAGIWLLFCVFFKSISPLISADSSLKGWLISGIVGSSMASLVYGAPQPAASSFVVGLSTLATIQRGWPLPWFGLVGLDVMFAPFTLLIDTTIWITLTCGLAHFFCTLLYSRQNKAVQPRLIQGTVVGVILLAFLLPVILPAPLIMNWLGL